MRHRAVWLAAFVIVALIFAWMVYLAPDGELLARMTEGLP